MVDSKQPIVIAIFGPTGVGKTSAAIDLALRYNGEVVNADSRYLYRHLEIGVAKPTHEERRGVRHHLIDVFDPTDFITIAQVQQMAYAAIDDILQRENLPIIVGGTPLYMNAIVDGWRIPEVAPDWTLREHLAQRIDREGLATIAAELAEIDPVAAKRSGRNPRRVIRALEIYHLTGVPMSELEGKEPPPYRILRVALTRDRDDLYRILDSRVDDQIAAGLIDEVRGLIAMGMSGEEPAFSSIGYRQLLPVLAGEKPLEQAVAQIKHDTHRYVRHQMTWLRKTPGLHWIDMGDDACQSGLRGVAHAHLDSTSTTES